MVTYDLDDLDDDNDGLTDTEELNYGTDSLLADSDGNGINDIQDVFQVIKEKSLRQKETHVLLKCRT